MSIGQLCDDNCAAVFRKHDLHVFKNNKLVLKGLRNYCDGLWDVPLPQYHMNMRKEQQLQQKINIIVPKNQTQYQLANFYHGALCSPTIKTLQSAINNNQLLSWPAIEKLNFPKVILDTKAIHMGHLDQERQNLQSTKIQITQQPNEKKWKQ